MLTAVPISVLLLGVLGMLVVAFAVTRMTVLERRRHRSATSSRPAGQRQIQRLNHIR